MWMILAYIAGFCTPLVLFAVLAEIAYRSEGN